MKTCKSLQTKKKQQLKLISLSQIDARIFCYKKARIKIQPDLGIIKFILSNEIKMKKSKV